jgi:phosphocarrier protein
MMVLAGEKFEIEVEIKNAQGLHMRPAMQFVDVASRYGASITVSNGDTEVDAKSIMQMTMLAATCGTMLKVRAEGPGSEKALDELRELVEERMFDEAPNTA